MYSLIHDRLSSGQVIMLDGGTGTEIERRGVPMSGEVWCAEANLTHPDAIRAVHVDYIRAGADIITANTFASSPLMFDAHGRLDDMVRIDAIALRLAREACDMAGAPQTVIAGSFSTMRPVTPGGDRTDTGRQWPARVAQDLMRRKAESLVAAGADFILLEMMRDLDYSLLAMEAATATGLPVWLGVAAERRADGQLAGFGRNDWRLADIVPALMGGGARVCSVMHTSPNDTDEALSIVAADWSGPLGAYPECGYFKMPGWQFVDIIAPDDLVEKARDWRRAGVTILGGCCGTGPEHVAALARAFKPAGEQKR